MSVSGAVDLSVTTTRLDLPPPPSPERLEELDAQAWAAGWNNSSWSWAYGQMLRLAVASALSARLMHVKTDRLATFGLVADPEHVTLRQLAALHRSHRGTAGQAFELAVSDAVEAEVPYVCDPIREGLRVLGVPHEGKLTLVTVGLEKIPAARREDFWGGLSEQFPAGATVRTGRPGRPANLETVLGRLAESTWQSMRIIDGDAAPSQLGRCDALVCCGASVVPVSFKINLHAVRAWRDVPLHLTLSQLSGGPRVLDGRRPPGEPRRVTVAFSREQWYLAFEEALNLVDSALLRADRRGMDRTGNLLLHMMLSRADRPLAEVLAELRVSAHQLGESEAGVRAIRSGDTFPVVDHTDLLQGWKDAGAMGQVVNGQQHIFGLAPRPAVQV